ncbi:hypothetical protein ACQP2F_05205 [Actinoplanes sp. CA-030573]|uniref:hypothetical protein n=1 Tax=Actinoplanes sp. CA-030573 TaxID=3239898 RepID=UPI003D949EDA
MTSQPQPAPGEGKSAGQYLRPLRDLAAYALVGATAVFLFLAIVDLIPDGADQFGYRTQGSFGNFINLETITFPIAAVLLSLMVQPRHPKAHLIVLAALVEYAVAAVFGLLFGVLIGLINQAGNNGARSAFEGLLARVAWLAVFAVAAYGTYLIWRNMFYTAKPKPQPGVYGQPAYNQPGTYPGQPGYGPPPGQPGFPPPAGGGYPAGGYQQPPAGGAPGQQPPPGYGPGTYGQPAPPPSWNQPPVAMPTGNAPTQPVPQGPYQPAPTSGVPASGAPAATDPTQVVPRTDPAPADDRTEKIDDRPGFGPAAEDPPRS